jgi:ubiquinone/menaquinone biosynthesis C-methylase UbiE
MDPPSVTNREIYDQVLADGGLHGEIRRRDLHRFADTLRWVLPGAESLLDVGCNTGTWLNFAVRHRAFRRHLGVDVAPSKIEQGRRRFPDLNLRVGFAEEIEPSEGRFDVVTCLEVLEHIPAWEGVFDSLFRLASRQVLITVPYRETIMQTVCVHCARLTPLYGHLRSYTEASFPARAGWSLTLVKLRDRDPDRSITWKVYRLFRPFYPWLLVDYRAG